MRLVRGRPLRRDWELQRLNLWQELQTPPHPRRDIKNTAAFIKSAGFHVVIYYLSTYFMWKWDYSNRSTLTKTRKLSGCTQSRDAVHDAGQLHEYIHIQRVYEHMIFIHSWQIIDYINNSITHSFANAFNTNRTNTEKITRDLTGKSTLKAL